MIGAIHQTFVQLPFEHRNKAIGRRCRGQCRVEFKAFEVSSTFRFNKHLNRLDFRMAPSLTSYSRPIACLLGAFGLLNFAMISHCWALVKQVASSFICFLL